jgi:two-component system, NarL family, sensor histidine kinase EvgS
MIIFRNTFFIICCLSTLLFASVKQNRLDLSNNELQYIRNNPTITIGVLDNFDPFSYKEDGKEEGLSIDVLKRIKELTGLKFKLKAASWHNILDDFKAGKLDVITDISYTKKRENFTLFTKPYYEIPTYIFGLENNTEFKQNINFKDKVVAVTKGMFYIDKLKNLGIKVLELESSLEKAKAVVEGRADYFFASYTTGVKAIRKSSLTSLKALGEFYGIKREDLRFGINSDRKILKSIFDKAMEKISLKELKDYANKWIVFRQEYKSYKKLDFTEEEQKYLDTKPIIKYSEVDWKPFSIIDDNKMKGIMKDFLDVIEKRTGLKFKYVPSSSWTNVLDMFKKNSIDIIPGIGSSGEENLMGTLSKRYAKYPIVIVTGKKYTYIDNLNDIKDKTVAIPKNYTTYNLIKKNYPKVKLIETKDVEDA